MKNIIKILTIDKGAGVAIADTSLIAKERLSNFKGNNMTRVFCCNPRYLSIKRFSGKESDLT
ncbi:MAG: hypothetical protein LBE35_08160 [Clostridiales bacterium]|nr:hypothetical protein [Clostridiales bacterium]